MRAETQEHVKVTTHLFDRHVVAATPDRLSSLAVVWFRRRINPVAAATLDDIQRWMHQHLDELGVGVSRYLVHIDEEVAAGQELGHGHVEAIATMQPDYCDGETSGAPDTVPAIDAGGRHRG